MCPSAFGLNPALDVSQYAHASWKYRDGFTKGIIYDVAQTPDGWLWLATEFGLVRFDGVKAVPWEPPVNQQLPSNNVRKLFVDRDGTLWISTLDGFASWKNGKLTRYSEFTGFAVGRAIQDREGSIWAAARTNTGGKLCQIRNDKTNCSGEGVLGPAPFALHEDRQGYLWVGTRNGVWRWNPGPPEFHVTSKEDDFIQDIAQDPDGALLTSSVGGIRRFIDGKAEMRYAFPAPLRQLTANRMLRDRDGGLWTGTAGGGIVHFHQGRIDVFSQADGLTGDSVSGLFEDREGNIWVSTVNGLDRFRDLPVVTYTTRQGLSRDPSTAVLTAKDGSIWFSTADGLNRMNNAEVTLYSSQVASFANNRAIRIIGLPDHRGSLFADTSGRIWISSLSGVGYLENDRYVPAAAPGGIIYALTQDIAGDLWIANPQRGLFRLSRGNEVQQIPWETLGRQGPGGTLGSNALQGGVWIGFEGGGVAWLRDGKVQASYTVANGLGRGRVNDLRVDQTGVLWIASEGGLSLLKNGRLFTITKESGLPCDGVHWSMPDDSGSVWLKMPCGLVRAKLSELESWSSGRMIQTTAFDGSDGVNPRAGAGGLSPHVAKSPDGRLWFWNLEGLGMVDPRHLPFNKLPPRVQIQQITADRKVYDSTAGQHIPPLVRDLVIDYTALSFVAPEKNRFRYKLEGYDPDWQDVGTRRQAFYTSPGPRHYRFRVQASNNDGVWNEAGASLDFSIDPAWYQTLWFRTSAVAAFFAMLWGLYRYRLHQLSRQFGMRMEERVNERTRIARDLHDTLLQGFQGVLLKFSAVSYMLPEDSRAKEVLEQAVDQARRSIEEGRDAVQGLRTSTLASNDLARTIGTIGEELAADSLNGHRPGFRIEVEGVPMDLAPLVRDEVCRIAVEALRNAFRHADAAQIEVAIHYEKRRLRVQVRDDGKGVDESILEAGGREGHHGLKGMHERAGLIRGKVEVWSKPGFGCEVELTVPAAVAYAGQHAQERRVS